MIIFLHNFSNDPPKFSRFPKKTARSNRCFLVFQKPLLVSYCVVVGLYCSMFFFFFFQFFELCHGDCTRPLCQERTNKKLPNKFCLRTVAQKLISIKIGKLNLKKKQVSKNITA